MGNLQSNPSSSTQTIEKKYDVFLNFRGVDTRDGFTNYLYKALLRKSIQTFRDEEKIPKGDQIWPTLLKAIRESKISVAIFSKEYASSKWCLRELVEILKSGQTVIPVFYNVTVHDVRHQEGSFKGGFDQLEKEFQENLVKEQVDSADVEKSKQEFYNEMQEWSRALKAACNLKGWPYEKGPESEIIDKIVKDIWEKLMRAYKFSCDFEEFVGIEERFEKVMSLLSLNNTDTRIIGIWGMGGIGKTTIAKVIFKGISDDEYDKCFIDNVRQRLEQYGGIVSLLRQEVISKLLDGQEMKSDGVILSKRSKESLSQKKVFIVLDDVDDSLKFLDLASGFDRVGPGSRIIITTRRMDILKICQVNNDYIYKVEGLSNQEARKLFCRHAFGRNPPIEDLMALSHETLQAIDGNPLGLIVAGSSLLGMTKLEWQSALNEIKKSKEILNVLQISYNGLTLEHQDIFLDIACFFVGKHEDYVAEILDNHRCALKVLSNRSLITISYNKSIQMHDLLQEMGKQIVCNEDLNNPSNRSRLWTPEDVLDTLKDGNVSNAMRGIFLDMSKMNEEDLSLEAFEKMKNLRFIRFYDSTTMIDYYNNAPIPSNRLCFRDDISYLSHKLRSLSWLWYPSKALPSNFIPNFLVELNMIESNIEKLWVDKVVRAPKLKWIILKRCPNLIKVLDSLDAPLLEKIEIQECNNLPGFCSPLHHFNNVRELKLSCCENLQSFPNDIRFPSLVSLDLSWCINLARISDVLDAPLLEKINLDGCKSLLDFPRPAQHFNKLRELELSWCQKLQSLPSNLQFPSLISLHLDGCVKFLDGFFSTSPIRDLSGLLGKYSHIQKFRLMLGIGVLDFRIVGIWGMVGIGKTALAGAVGNLVGSEFEKCCFINIRASSNCGRLAHLREELLSWLLGEESLKFGTPNGPEFVRHTLKSRKVLVVLDGMTELKQLEALLGGIDGFGPGSRIVITSRDKQLLSDCGSHDIYEVEALDDQDAFRLLCKHAFKQDHCPEELLVFAQKVVDYAKGNPLALKILGSYFYQRTKQEWESAVLNFKNSCMREIFWSLRISYEELVYEEKEIFLDIAFFFKGMDRDYVTKILDCCYSSVQFRISALVDKSLITISKTNEIEMNDLLQEMGWSIVYDESRSHPGERSRLKDHKVVRDILLYGYTKNGTIKGIVLDMSKIKDIALNSEAFEKLYNLKFLKFYSQTQCSGHPMSASKVHAPHGLNYLPNELRSLHWQGYPLKTLPTEFSLENLVELNLPYSNLEQLWEGVKAARCLKLLILCHSQNLTSLPDLSYLPCLEVMNLEDCRSLSEIPVSIQQLDSLYFLCLKGCESLRSIPSGICSLRSLYHLDLSNCSELDKLLENLRNLVCLKYLFLNHCGLKEIPEDIGSLSSLELLELCGNKFDSLPTSIEQLSKLRTLLLNNCSMLQSLTRLPSGLQSLEAVNCKQLQSLPDTSELAGVIRERFIKEYERAFSVSICLPGSVIPDWFNHQRIGSLDASKLVGFALCAVIAFENYSDDGRGVRVSFKSHNSDTMDFCGSLTICDTRKYNHAISMYSDHIVQGYYPFLNCIDILSVEFSLQNFDGQPIEGCKVKNCAVCPLYAEEPTEARKFSDETDTSGSESGRLDVEEMDPHPKIIAEELE